MLGGDIIYINWGWINMKTRTLGDQDLKFSMSLMVLNDEQWSYLANKINMAMFGGAFIIVIVIVVLGIIVAISYVFFKNW